MSLNRDKALVVFSGGQDSTTCLYWAKRHFKEVYAVCFSYGQKHRKETDIARKLASEANVPFELINADFIGRLSTTCSLTDTSIQMDQEKPDDTFPNTFVPGRNMFFLSIAAVYARERGIMHIVTGVSQTDFSGYPDCRAAFIRSQQKTMRLALEWPIRIVTPFMHMSKADEWELAFRLGILEIIEDETLTCYNGIPGKGCGKCPSCRLRNRGYAEFRKRSSSGIPPQKRG